LDMIVVMHQSGCGGDKVRLSPALNFSSTPWWHGGMVVKLHTFLTSTVDGNCDEETPWPYRQSNHYRPAHNQSLPYLPELFVTIVICYDCVYVGPCIHGMAC
jgi:hypothetical protein